MNESKVTQEFLDENPDYIGILEVGDEMPENNSIDGDPIPTDPRKPRPEPNQ